MAREKRDIHNRHGHKNYNSKLSEKQVVVIRNISKEIYEEAIKTGIMRPNWRMKLARHFKVHRSTIDKILLGQTWTK